MASYAEILSYHNRTNPLERHIHEAIREGCPCHLYLDVEYPRAENPDKDGESAVRTLIEMVSENVALTFGKNIAEVVMLDSTTAAKFSRHLVLKVEGAAFEANTVVGDVVGDVIDAQTGCEDSPLFCVSEFGTRQCIVDLAVYSRNRFFRVLGSCKYGKTALLAPTAETAARYAGNSDGLFLASLVCNVDDGAVLLRSTKGVAASNSRQAASLSSSPSSLPHDMQLMEYCPGSSPFPRVEKFVSGLIRSTGDGSGTIRTIKCNPANGLLMFSITGNRYCERIQRQHKVC